MQFSVQHFFVLLGQVAAALTAAGVVYRFVVRPFISSLRKISAVYDKVDKLAGEFQRNGGGSLRDAIDRIETATLKQDERQKILLGIVPFGITETTPDGKLIFANRTYLRWTEREEREVFGDGWINVIHPEDRDRVIEEWELACSQRRAYEGHYRMISLSGATFPVYCRALPMYADPLRIRILGYIAILVRCTGPLDCPLHDESLPPEFKCVWEGCPAQRNLALRRSASA